MTQEQFSGIQMSLGVRVVEDAAAAIAAGFVYRRPLVLPLRISKVLVVRKGTERGRASVDFLMHDENGQQYVVMLTKQLLDAIPGNETP